MKKTLNDRIYDFFLVFIQKVCHIKLAAIIKISI